MAQAKYGDVVSVHYTGSLEDGTVFDSSADREPLEFSIGEGSIIPGFEQAVIGMSPGESKTEKIPADKAYGAYFPEMVVVVSREQIPPDMPTNVGDQLQIQQPDGQLIPVVVTDMNDSDVTLDANHPLAGENLTFQIQLVAIN
jgi:peptidylprolyl isomerase